MYVRRLARIHIAPRYLLYPLAVSSMSVATSVASTAATGHLPRCTSAAASPPRGTLAHGVSLLNQQDAIDLDVDLMREPGFSLDQLMELAGLSCACAAAKLVPPKSRILLVCGPGNNGGDGLVAARHLHHFGYLPVVVYPKQPQKQLFANLVAQQEQLGIPVLSELPPIAELEEYSLLVDAIFGFSFRGAPRAPFGAMLKALNASTTPVLSIDIPSGWNVEHGPPRQAEGGAEVPALMPEALISLTAPKLCTRHFSGGRHFLGGRFVPPEIVEKYELVLPAYPGTEQVVELPWKIT